MKSFLFAILVGFWYEVHTPAKWEGGGRAHFENTMQIAHTRLRKAKKTVTVSTIHRIATKNIKLEVFKIILIC